MLQWVQVVIAIYPGFCGEIGADRAESRRPFHISFRFQDGRVCYA
jgi:hypothetical protein